MTRREGRPHLWYLLIVRHLKYVHSVFALTHWDRDEIDAILKTTFTNALSWMKMYWFRLKFHCNLFRGPINNIASLIQIMAWRRTGAKPLSEPMLVRSLTHIRITRPQWVKTWYLFIDTFCHWRQSSYKHTQETKSTPPPNRNISIVHKLGPDNAFSRRKTLSLSNFGFPMEIAGRARWENDPVISQLRTKTDL